MEAAIDEKRHTPRALREIRLHISTLSRLAVLEEPTISLQGVTENVSAGGVCLLTDRALPLNSVVRCELAVSETPMSIPTLMQVRWLQSLEAAGKYKVGMQFLL